MSKWTTIVLAVLLGGALFALVLLQDVPPTPSDVPAALLDFRPAEVEGAELKGAAGSATLARDAKDRERWRVRVKGAMVRANSTTVEELLNELSRLKPRQVFKARDVKTGERERWTLAKPSHEAKLALPGRTLRAAFGAQTLDGVNSYAEREAGGDVFIVPTTAMQAIDRATVEGALRERKPAGFGSYEAQGIELARKDGSRFVAEKGTAYAWEVTAPYKGHADPVRMEEFLGRVLGIEVQDFEEDGAPDLDRYGLREPSLTISVRRQGREGPLVLRIGNDVPDRPRTWFSEEGEPSVYSCSRPTADALRAFDPASLRDSNCLRLGYARLDSMEFSHAGVSWTLRRNVDKWEIEKPERGPAEPDSVEALLEVLRNLQVESFLDAEEPSAHGIPNVPDAPGRLVLTGTGANGNRNLVLGRPREDGLLAACLDGNKPVMLLKSGILDRLRKGWLEFKSREVLKVELAEVRGLSRRTGAGEESFLRAEGTWRQAPGGPEPDGERLTMALSRVLTVRADGFVEKTKGDLDRYGLGEAPAGGAITLVLRKEGEAKDRTATLVIGAEVPGSPGDRYARLADGEFVFRLASRGVRGSEVQEFLAPLLGPLAKAPGGNRPDAPKEPPPPPKDDGPR